MSCGDLPRWVRNEVDGKPGVNTDDSGMDCPELCRAVVGGERGTWNNGERVRCCITKS